MEPNFQVLPPVPPEQRPPEPRKPYRANARGWIGVVVVSILKYKYVLAGLKTSLSMLLAIGAYTWLFGWFFAVGLVLAILVHELGHVVAAKCLGLPVSALLFIPFFGAATTLKENPRDAWTGALFAYGGPLAGCICSWICLLVAQQYEMSWLMAIASVSFFLNLFNLIPVPPFDGGSICAAVSTWFWLVGLFFLGVAVLYFKSWNAMYVIVIVMLMGWPRIAAMFMDEPSEALQEYYRVHLSNRVCMALMYLGLIAALLLGYWHASDYLSYLSPDDQ